MYCKYTKVRKLFKGGNYSRAETIQGRKLFAEIRYVPLDPQKLPLEFINIHPPKRGSASRIHQYTAPQKEVRLQNSLTYSPQKGACLQNSSIYCPKTGVRLQNSSTYSPQKGRFHQPKRNPIHQEGGLPLGTISMDQPVRHNRISKYWPFERRNLLKPI